MSASLVGSEMCIRDRPGPTRHVPCTVQASTTQQGPRRARPGQQPRRCTCLLYTSDAADDM
eukprot:1800832-Alexandrium_andersonii.AAC.1